MPAASVGRAEPEAPVAGVVPAVNPARAGWAAHPAPVEPPANQVSPANQDNRGNPAARDISACGWRRRA